MKSILKISLSVTLSFATCVMSAGSFDEERHQVLFNGTEREQFTLPLEKKEFTIPVDIVEKYKQLESLKIENLTNRDLDVLSRVINTAFNLYGNDQVIKPDDLRCYSTAGGNLATVIACFVEEHGILKSESIDFANFVLRVIARGYIINS